jgi:hypothetical protein
VFVNVLIDSRAIIIWILAFWLSFLLLSDILSVQNMSARKKREEKIAEFNCSCGTYPNNVCYVCGLLAPFSS